MKTIKKHIHLCLLAFGLLISTVACEDLAFGDKFLQKPPSTDVTIDTIFSTAEYARRVLWYTYQHLPMGLEDDGSYFNTLWLSPLEGLTDLNQDYLGYSGVNKIYYAGYYNAGLEDTRSQSFMTTKCRFNNGETHYWSAIRNAWLVVANIDRVPDMSAEEKSRLKAEAKVLVAVYYTHMLRHFGALPIIDHVLSPDEPSMPPRATLQQTVDFIVRVLNEAIDCPELPWRIAEEDVANWDGRMTKASAMALKVRLLLFVASPLFNSDQPYFPGEASEKLMTWFGGYDKERWKAAIDACEQFFAAVEREGFYRLVQKEDVNEGDYRYAFRKAYFDRGTTEALISVRSQNLFKISDKPYMDQAQRWGSFCPTKEYFDMFQTADGEAFDWNNPDHAKNPFINRDPRLNETFILDGDIYQGGHVQVTKENPKDKVNYPAGKHWGSTGAKLPAKCLTTGIACRKWGLDRKGEYNGHIVQWPHLRIAEIHLSYAEALNEYYGTPNDLAYFHVNEVRKRVGMKGLKEMQGELNQEQFREALLRERACEFGFEEVRFFDLIRWKKKDIFSKVLHGINIYKNKNDGSYICEEFSLLGGAQNRIWWNEGGFSEKWYLSAFPQQEVNKGYGLVQNPGWE